MNKISIALFFAVMSTFFACTKKNNTPVNSSKVMFVNGCAGVQGTDVKVSAAVIQGAQGILFQHSSDYKYITAGTDIDIAFYITNLGTKLVNQSVTLTSGGNYSVFAGGIITKPTFLLAADDLSAPASNAAKIRVVNLASDTLNITATAGTTNFATNVGNNTASAFASVTAGQYVLKVGDPSKLSTVVSPSTVMLSAGKIYTLIYTGSETGTGVSAINATLLNNN